MTIGFIGNPNCGKTTLFNAYTGANLKVANWPGVTVEKVEGAIKDHDLNIRLVDLPGTYSLTSYTMEEQVSRQFILSDEVDVIIDVADASALERNLYLTLQLLELGKPVVLALNMMDIVEKRGMEIDTHRLPELLGIPVIPVSARKRTGLDVLLHAAAHHKDCKDPECLIHHHKYISKHRHNHHAEYAMVYSDNIEDKIDLIIEELKRKYPDLTNYRWHAIKLLEQDQEITKRYSVNLPRYHSGLMDMNTLNPGQDFDDLPESYVIFITRDDALGYGLPIYHIDRKIEEVSENFKDEAHIIYVNSKKQEDTELGRLMHDLHCKNAEDMHSKILADRVYELKETQKGVEFMCREMEQIYSEGIESGEMQKAKETTIALAEMGLPADKIAKAVKIGVDVVQKWIDESMSVAH